MRVLVVLGTSAGGVGRHWPGRVPGTATDGPNRPSFERAASIVAAADWPIATPAVFAGPPGIPARLVASCPSRVPACAGKSPTRTSWAAAAAAADFDSDPSAAGAARYG